MSDQRPEPTCGGAARGAEAVDALLERHLPSLLAFVRLRAGKVVRDRESHSDLVQSVCRELLAGREGFTYRGENEFRNWLYTAVLRKVVERARYHRAQKRDVAREVRPPAEQDRDERSIVACYATFVTPSRELASAEEMRRIEAAFDELTEEQREIITLARIVGLPHNQIAARLGCSEASCRQQLHRALIRLSMVLDRQERG
jgi:RNA polymerase sigma factor (sigma-70 family)